MKKYRAIAEIVKKHSKKTAVKVANLLHLNCFLRIKKPYSSGNYVTHNGLQEVLGSLG